MELKAPGSGLLSLQARNCSGAITSADCKPYKVGDNVSSGMILGEIPDLEHARNGRQARRGGSRPRRRRSRSASCASTPSRNSPFPAKVSQVSALAELRMEYPYTRSFRAYAALLKPDPRLRPDMNGGMDIIVSRIPNAISIPSKALFTRAGKPIVYLAEPGPLSGGRSGSPGAQPGRSGHLRRSRRVHGGAGGYREAGAEEMRIRTLIFFVACAGRCR